KREVGGGSGACTGATKYFGVPRPGLRGTKPFGVARGAPEVGAGGGAATLACTGAGAGGGWRFDTAWDCAAGAAFGAALGGLAGACLPAAGRAVAFFVAGSGARAVLDLGGVAFLTGAELRTAFLLATVFFVPAAFFVALAVFFFDAAGLPLADAARPGADLAAGRAREALAVGFFGVFLSPGFFT